MKNASQQYSPTMTKDYSRISDTARAVDAEVLPRMASYIRRISPKIAASCADEVFVIADYGAADGVNSSELFEAVIRQIHKVNPALTIKLVYIDLADPSNFETFWATSALAKLEHVEAQYIQRSFYEPFPEIRGKLQIGFSSTALHWLNAKTVGPDYFLHPLCIQPNQLSDLEQRKFAEKWKADWRSFLQECSRSLVKGGALVLANLANRGVERLLSTRQNTSVSRSTSLRRHRWCRSSEVKHSLRLTTTFSENRTTSGMVSMFRSCRRLKRFPSIFSQAEVTRFLTRRVPSRSIIR